MATDCKVSYHHNYYIKAKSRHYYTQPLPIIELGEHQFAERKVVDLWINAMLFSHTSATNCARLYHHSFSRHNLPPFGWPFGFTLKTEHVWDAFIITCLLDDFSRLNAQLIVPNIGPQKDRFNEAMKARNLRFRLLGQPELNHRCEKCTRIYKGAEVWVVVVDGVTVGHPCCGVHNCFEPLENQRDQFCNTHKRTEGTRCCIKGCTQARENGSRVCLDPEHVEAERVHIERGQARFQLKDRLERARVAHPNDSIAEGHPADDVDDELEQDIEIAVAIQNHARNADTQRKRLRAQFGRRRTHNEQLVVAPCGMVLARQTFYGAEGVNSVAVSDTLPCQVLFFSVIHPELHEECLQYWAETTAHLFRQ
jgi:hypothetical protein